MAAAGAAGVVTCGIVSRQLLKLQLWHATGHLEDGKETQSAIACAINRVSPNPQHAMHPAPSNNLERKEKTNKLTPQQQSRNSSNTATSSPPRRRHDLNQLISVLSVVCRVKIRKTWPQQTAKRVRCQPPLTSKQASGRSSQLDHESIRRELFRKRRPTISKLRFPCPAKPYPCKQFPCPAHDPPRDSIHPPSLNPFNQNSSHQFFPPFFFLFSLSGMIPYHQDLFLQNVLIIYDCPE